TGALTVAVAPSAPVELGGGLSHAGATSAMTASAASIEARRRPGVLDECSGADPVADVVGLGLGPLAAPSSVADAVGWGLGPLAAPSREKKNTAQSSPRRASPSTSPRCECGVLILLFLIALEVDSPCVLGAAQPAPQIARRPT